MQLRWEAWFKTMISGRRGREIENDSVFGCGRAREPGQLSRGSRE